MLEAPEIPATDFLKEEDRVEKDRQSPLVRTWKKMRNWSNYRMARSADFRIPEWVEQERYWTDVDRATNYPYNSGEMSGANGVGLIVIDKTVSDAKKFSCVVFISRGGDRYELYWIFRNEDLSHFTMGRHSGDVYLAEYRDDGTSRVCDIQYSRKLRRWACEFY